MAYLIAKCFTKFDFIVISFPPPPTLYNRQAKDYAFESLPEQKKKKKEISIIPDYLYTSICINSILVPEKSKTCNIVSSINARMRPFFNEIN